MRTHHGDYLRDVDGAVMNLIASPDRAGDLSLGDVIFDWRGHGEWSWWCFCSPLHDGDENFDHSAIVIGFDSKNEPLVTYRNAAGEARPQPVLESLLPEASGLRATPLQRG